MKKIVLIIYIIFLGVYSAHSQDPAISSPSINPAPGLVGDPVTFGFEFKNTDANPVPYDQANPVLLMIKLQKVVPDPEDGSSVSGPGSLFFDWTYDSGNSMLIGTQKEEIPGKADPFTTVGGQVEISAVVTEASTAEDAQSYNGHGFEARIRSTASQDVDRGEGSNKKSIYTYANEPPLPVKLISFTLEQSGEDVVLNWETSGEINNSHFDVEVSVDAVNFTYLGTVQGHGNTEAVQQYSYTDHQPSSGVTYYRLKQVDYDGSYEYFIIRSIDVKGIGGVFIYPNPAVNHVVLSNLAQGTSIEVVDIRGRVLLKRNNLSKSSEVLDVSNFETGSYLLRFIANDHVDVKRLNINR